MMRKPLKLETMSTIKPEDITNGSIWEFGEHQNEILVVQDVGNGNFLLLRPNSEDWSMRPQCLGIGSAYLLTAEDISRFLSEANAVEDTHSHLSIVENYPDL